MSGDRPRRSPLVATSGLPACYVSPSSNLAKRGKDFRAKSTDEWPLIAVDVMYVDGVESHCLVFLEPGEMFCGIGGDTHPLGYILACHLLTQPVDLLRRGCVDHFITAQHAHAPLFVRPV